jgi:transposase
MPDKIPLCRRSVEPPRITMGEGKSPRGRKSRLIEQKVLIRLRDSLATGNTYENACVRAGIGRSTFYRWMDESKTAPEGHPLREFRDTVKRASAIAEHYHVMLIQKAAERHWQAAAWWLERRYPRQYGRRKPLPIGSDPNGLLAFAG